MKKLRRKFNEVFAESDIPGNDTGYWSLPPLIDAAPFIEEEPGETESVGVLAARAFYEELEKEQQRQKQAKTSQ